LGTAEHGMTDNILSHNEMCRREGVSLQRGMNFGLGGNHSVILMSVRPNAPYCDQLEEGGTILIYEGHDHPKDASCPNPKVVDQPGQLPSGKLTQNGKFHHAAQEFKSGRRSPERVRVYEKIKSGIWSYNGIFHLVDSWQERDSHRTIFKFRLIAVEGDEDFEQPVHVDAERRRIIPTAVKLEVWKRDGGKCRLCDASDELHFDHIVPFSRGGTSLTAENVQLLCARHNLQKRDRIE
jgi:hypothetical protein